MADKKLSELTVTHEGGTRFGIRVRGHDFVVDQPVRAGGTDAAPTPTELFIASIAGCAAFYGRTYLARRGLPDRVDVDVRWEIALKPDRVTNVSLVVEAPGVPAERMDAFRRVLEGCLVHNTLERGCDIHIELRSDVPKAAPAAM
jgi:putative redox protein